MCLYLPSQTLFHFHGIASIECNMQGFYRCKKKKRLLNTVDCKHYSLGRKINIKNNNNERACASDSWPKNTRQNTDRKCISSFTEHISLTCLAVLLKKKNKKAKRRKILIGLKKQYSAASEDAMECTCTYKAFHYRARVTTRPFGYAY